MAQHFFGSWRDFVQGYLNCTQHGGKKAYVNCYQDYIRQQKPRWNTQKLCRLLATEANRMVKKGMVTRPLKKNAFDAIQPEEWGMLLDDLEFLNDVVA